MRSAPFALLVALALLGPVALADHDYAHRYVVEGRLVGSDGLPLAAREVSILTERDDLSVPCSDGRQESLTDEWGDFRFCYHKHDVVTGARIHLSAGNATAVRPFDDATRRTVVMLQEPNETGVAPPGWNASYRVGGKAWRATGPQTHEGVRVIGEAVPGLEVTVLVRTADNESRFVTRTDSFGDYDVVLEAVDDPDAISVWLEVDGRPTVPVALDRTFHRSVAPIFLTGAKDALVADAASVREQTPPGSAAPPVPAGLVIGVVAALIVVAWGTAKARAKK